MNNHTNATIDDVKNFWNTRPCNIRHSTKEIGSREYFDEVERRKYFVEPHIVKFADFESWASKSVLEIGCGIGTDAVNFARAKANYTGVELSHESLEIAKKRFDVFNLQGEFIEGDAESIGQVLSGKKFDLIYSFGVLHHTPNITKAINSIRTLCHSGSTFKFMVYATNSWKSHMISIGLDQPEAQTGCPIANTYSELEISDILKKSGFNLQSIEQDHIFPYQVEKYVNYQYELEPWFGAMPENMFKALEKKMGWHLLITAKPA